MDTQLIPFEETFVGTGAATVHGPTGRKDTLWSIARKFQSDKPVSVHQVMAALMRANPHAFYENNADALRRGVFLTLPSDHEILSISHDDAVREIQGRQAERRTSPDRAPTSESNAMENGARVPGGAERSIHDESVSSILFRTETDGAAPSSEDRDEYPQSPRMLQPARVGIAVLAVLAAVVLFFFIRSKKTGSGDRVAAADSEAPRVVPVVKDSTDILFGEEESTGTFPVNPRGLPPGVDLTVRRVVPGANTASVPASDHTPETDVSAGQGPVPEEAPTALSPARKAWTKTLLPSMLSPPPDRRPAFAMDRMRRNRRQPGVPSLVRIVDEPSRIMAFSILTAGLVAFFLVLNPTLGAAVGVLPFIVWFGVTDKKYILFLFLLLLPYHGTPFFTENLLGITGFKPFQLLAAFLMLVFFFHGGRLFRHADKVEQKAMWFFSLYLFVFALAVFRSLDYLPLLRGLSPEVFHASPVNHILSFFVRPALFALSFIYILKHMRTEKEIEQCVDAICASVFLLSCVVLGIVLVNLDQIVLGRAYVTEAVSAFFSFHRNAVGSIYITCIPLLVLRAIDKSPFSLLNFVMAGTAILFLQSRSTIVVFFCGSVLLLYLLKRWRALILLSSVVALLFLVRLPGFLEQALLIGMETGRLNDIFTGRIDNIWIPLIMDRIANPGQLLFGVGIYSIIASPVYLQKGIFQVGHPHNAFLELIIDLGLLLFIVFVFFLIFFLKKAWSLAAKSDAPMAWALFACIVTYLAGALTGRNLYPSRNSMYLFPVTALLINYFRVRFFTEPPRNISVSHEK